MIQFHNPREPDYYLSVPTDLVVFQEPVFFFFFFFLDRIKTFFKKRERERESKREKEREEEREPQRQPEGTESRLPGQEGH